MRARPSLKIMIATDAWEPQVNGVVRTLRMTKKSAEAMGHQVLIVGPEPPSGLGLPVPSYPDIKLDLFAHPRLARLLAQENPDTVHIATEGPLGLAMRDLCLHERRPFTTAYHTRFPEYLAARMPRPFSASVAAASRRFLRWFHEPSRAVMAPTLSIRKSLRLRRFKRVVLWARGVDTALFRPQSKDGVYPAVWPRPYLLYVGRVSIEKNLKAFLALRTPGTKIVIGEGPDLEDLRRAYSAVRFLGPLNDDARLAASYAAADLFVFPSKTDTFGLVLLEAAASGLRLASYPAPGPADLFGRPETNSFAVLNENLEAAVQKALTLPDNPAAPRAFAETYSWEACTAQFLASCEKALYVAPPKNGRKRSITKKIALLRRRWS